MRTKGNLYIQLNINLLNPHFSLMQMKKLLILALCTGILLFVPNFIERGFTYDEALYLSIGRNLSQDFKDYTMNSNYMLYRPPVLPYLISITSRVAGGFSGGISMGITPFFSFLLIVLLYIVIKHFYDEKIAFFSAVFLLLCPLYLRHSVRVLNHVEFAFFFSMALFSFRKGLQGRFWWFFLSGILGGLAFLTRYVGVMYIPVMGLYVLLERKTEFYKEKGCYLSFFSFFIPVIPWALFSNEVYNGYYEFMRVAMAVIPTDDFMHTVQYIAVTILELTPFFILFTILGIKRLKRDSFFLAYFCGTLLTLVLLRHREPRFILDFSPVLALSAGVFAASIYERKKTLIHVVIILLLLQSAGEVVYTSQFELHIKEAGLYIAQSPVKGAVIANEEAQMYYYTQRKVYFYPLSEKESKILLQEDAAFFVVNHCSPPPYLDELLQNSQWELIFATEKGCGASIYSGKNFVFDFV